MPGISGGVKQDKARQDKAKKEAERSRRSAPANTLLDRLQGIKTIGQRIDRYDNNPNVEKNRSKVGKVPSYPNASPGIIAGGFIDAVTSATPLGFGMNMANVIGRGLKGGDYSSGLAMDAMKAMGAELGPRGPDVGASMDRQSGKDDAEEVTLGKKKRQKQTLVGGISAPLGTSTNPYMIT